MCDLQPLTPLYVVPREIRGTGRISTPTIPARSSTITAFSNTTSSPSGAAGGNYGFPMCYIHPVEHDRLFRTWADGNLAISSPGQMPRRLRTQRATRTMWHHGWLFRCMLPLGISSSTRMGSKAYVTFHRSCKTIFLYFWTSLSGTRSSPVGYRIASISFDTLTGQPTDPPPPIIHHRSIRHSLHARSLAVHRQVFPACQPGMGRLGPSVVQLRQHGRDLCHVSEREHCSRCCICRLDSEAQWWSCLGYDLGRRGGHGSCSILRRRAVDDGTYRMRFGHVMNVMTRISMILLPAAHCALLVSTPHWS